MKRAPMWILCALAAPLLLACNSSGVDRMIDSYADVVGHMQDCGLMSEGRIADDVLRLEARDMNDMILDFNVCYFDCVATISCDTMATGVCSDDDSESTAYDRAMGACYADCIPLFTCGDGDTVTYDLVCNGDSNCDDGSDEADCPTVSTDKFDCADGGQVSVTYRCDGSLDCNDGSDEEECPEFRCATGEVISASIKCDTRADCPDMSDETDCGYDPEFKCADGSVVFVRGDCNGEIDCADGSDETGCAAISCEE